MAKFGSKLTDRQMAFARLVADNGIDSISQAVKALERRDREAYADWLRIFGCLWMSK